MSDSLCSALSWLWDPCRLEETDFSPERGRSWVGCLPNAPERVPAHHAFLHTHHLTTLVTMDGETATSWRLLVAFVINPEMRAASEGFPVKSAAFISSCLSVIHSSPSALWRGRNPPSSEHGMEKRLQDCQAHVDPTACAIPSPSAGDGPPRRMHCRRGTWLCALHCPQLFQPLLALLLSRDFGNTLLVVQSDSLPGPIDECFPLSDLCVQRLILCIFLRSFQRCNESVLSAPLEVPHCCDGLLQPGHFVPRTCNLYFDNRFLGTQCG